MTNEQAVPFRAEMRQLLNILTHSLYSDREIFLRELISNAADAINRVRFIQLTNPNIVDADVEPQITISVDTDANTITISDNGSGMTREELSENLGTIAKSGTKAMLENLDAGQRSALVGQFGVGFYSAFVVADEVTVVSRSYQPDAEAAEWWCDGNDTFVIRPSDRTARGTTITLRLKADASEFASEWRLKQIVRKHSRYVPVPILMGEETVNDTQALWRVAPRTVEASRYADFYQQLTYEMTDPLLTVHLSTDAPIDLHALLFVPATRERGMIERRVEGNVALYSRRVLIQAETKEMLPQWLRFMEGVVDSEDLPLNVSREMVQGSQTAARIKKTLTSRVIKELNDLGNNDPEKFATFWKEFGIFFKEGVAVDPSAQTEIVPLLRFHSSTQDSLTTLAEYVSRMVPDQDEIYYLIANDVTSAKQSPHLDAVQSRGIEALLLSDMVDPFMLQNMRDFDGKKFHNLDDPELTLPGSDTQVESQIDDNQLMAIVTGFKDTLGEQIDGVQASTVLKNHPVRLVATNSNSDQERMRRLIERDTSAPKRKLEVNRAHPLIVGLAQRLQANPSDVVAHAIIAQLYDSALMLDGTPSDPAAMVKRLEAIMLAAVKN